MRTGFRVIAAALGWFAIVTAYAVSVSSKSAPLTWTIDFFSYFTVIANILVTLAMTLPWLAPKYRLAQWFERPSVRTVLAVYIIMVGVVYQVLARKLGAPHVWGFVDNIILHYLIPTLFAFDWLLFVPKHDLSWRATWGGLVLPILYVVWTFLHGAVAGYYPYPFINVTQLGYEQVLAHIAGLIMIGIGLQLALIGIGRLIDPARPTATRSSASGSPHPTRDRRQG